MTLKQRVDQHDREIAAIRTLIKTGMRLLIENQEQQRALRKEVRELVAAQKRTDAALRGFIESRRGGNGHSKRKVDLQ